MGTDDEGENPSYGTILDDLGAVLPRLAARLSAAEGMRRARAGLMLDGVRFAGLEQLLSTLDGIADAWNEDPQLQRVAFLVRRATADFETAIEAGLSGYPSIAADAMRDVMEVELLLLDFFVEPARLDLWLTADRKERLRAFAPAALRRRLIELGLDEIVGTPTVELDYRGHSEALHVTPVEPLAPFVRKGHVDANDVMSLDSSFIEIFEHARRLGNAMLLLSDRLSPDSMAAHACRGPLPAFELGVQRTQEIVAQFRDMLFRKPSDRRAAMDELVPSRTPSEQGENAPKQTTGEEYGG